MSRYELCDWCNGKGCDQCGGAGKYEILTREGVEREREKREREKARRDYPQGRPQ